MSPEASLSSPTSHSVCQCWLARCSAFCTTGQRWQERRRLATICFAQSCCKGEEWKNAHHAFQSHGYFTCWKPFFLLFSHRCQWQVEANGAISPALTPSPSPLPLTIEEDREFTYPSDVLIPPPGLMPGTYFDLPRIRLPPGVMCRLREVSGRARPQFRPSIK